MAPPNRQKTLDLVIPPGEAQLEYAPSGLAWKVQNLVDAGDMTLRSIDGPCPYEPIVGLSTLGAAEPHGIYHAKLLGGLCDMLLYRAGDTLYRHNGSGQNWKILATGLSDDSRSVYPDAFALINDQIIWTNGVDRARVIRFDDMVVPLGFDRTPSAPTSFGPAPLDSGTAESVLLGASKQKHYPNCIGYAWQGGIGTSGGLLEGQAGSILPGAWYYHQQWEDIYGNLSALSPASNPAYVWSMQADPYSASTSIADATRDIPIGTKFPFGSTHLGVELDDLTRQFAVQCGDDPPDHAVRLHLYRTADTRNVANTPRFLTAFSLAGKVTFPDTLPDSVLQAPAIDRVPVPVFRVMTTHQGALVIGNFPDAPGLVMRSDPGFPGTFASNQRVYPDSGGAEVTAVTTHGGVLLAFTESSVYSLEDFGSPRPLSRSAGCVAPGSIAALPSGHLVWLGRKGFYAMEAGGAPFPISDVINLTMRRDINHGRVRLATAAVNPENGTYRCALAPAGSSRNTLILTFSGEVFKRLDLGIHIASMCASQDYRELMLVAGTDLSLYTPGALASKASNVYVLDRETMVYDPPVRTCIFQSGWMQADSLGLTPVNLRTLYVGMRDACNSTARVTFYKNGSWRPIREPQPLLLVGLDVDSGIVTDIAGAAVVNQSSTHSPRRFWRKVSADLQDASSWAFKIECDYPDRMHLVAFSFDLSAATGGNVRERLPAAEDV